MSDTNCYVLPSMKSVLPDRLDTWEVDSVSEAHGALYSITPIFAMEAGERICESG